MVNWKHLRAALIYFALAWLVLVFATRPVEYFTIQLELPKRDFTPLKQETDEVKRRVIPAGELVSIWESWEQCRGDHCLD